MHLKYKGIKEYILNVAGQFHYLVVKPSCQVVWFLLWLINIKCRWFKAAYVLSLHPE